MEDGKEVDEGGGEPDEPRLAAGLAGHGCLLRRHEGFLLHEMGDNDTGTPASPPRKMYRLYKPDTYPLPECFQPQVSDRGAGVRSRGEAAPPVAPGAKEPRP
ncbi:hypothetical protein GCM10027445_67050 [Amycolatopsis endophytica]